MPLTKIYTLKANLSRISLFAYKGLDRGQILQKITIIQPTPGGYKNKYRVGWHK